MPGFSGNVLVETPVGLMSFDELRAQSNQVEVKNETGDHRAELIVERYTGMMIDMGARHLVMPDQLMRVSPFPFDTWRPAREHFAGYQRVDFDGDVFDLHVLSFQPRDHHFLLGNGEVAHNKNDARNCEFRASKSVQKVSNLGSIMRFIRSMLKH